MSSSYRIDDLGSGLRIRWHRDMESWERLLAACFAGVVAAVAASTFLKTGWCVIVAFGVAATVFVAVRRLNAELRATNGEFVCRGYLDRRGPTNRIVCTGDVRSLEFQEPNGQLPGLYAVTARRELCILPFLEYGQ